EEWGRGGAAQRQGQDRGQNQGQDGRQGRARDRGEDRIRERYDRRRARYDEWRRARYEGWRGREREDWTRRREAERGDAVMRPTRGGPFGAVVEKLVRGCGAQGAEVQDLPFHPIPQSPGAVYKDRTAVEVP